MVNGYENTGVALQMQIFPHDFCQLTRMGKREAGIERRCALPTARCSKKQVDVFLFEV